VVVYDIDLETHQIKGHAASWDIEPWEVSHFSDFLFSSLHMKVTNHTLSFFPSLHVFSNTRTSNKYSVNRPSKSIN